MNPASTASSYADFHGGQLGHCLAPNFVIISFFSIEVRSVTFWIFDVILSVVISYRYFKLLECCNLSERISKLYIQVVFYKLKFCSFKRCKFYDIFSRCCIRDSCCPSEYFFIFCFIHTISKWGNDISPGDIYRSTYVILYHSFKYESISTYMFYFLHVNFR